MQSLATAHGGPLALAVDHFLGSKLRAPYQCPFLRPPARWLRHAAVPTYPARLEVRQPKRVRQLPSVKMRRRCVPLFQQPQCRWWCDGSDGPSTRGIRRQREIHDGSICFIHIVSELLLTRLDRVRICDGPHWPFGILSVLPTGD
jgi:hypothetical protein